MFIALTVAFEILEAAVLYMLRGASQSGSQFYHAESIPMQPDSLPLISVEAGVKTRKTWSSEHR